MQKHVLAAMLVLMAGGCREECGPYSRFRCSVPEESTYNVQFEYPNNRKEYFLGQVHGIQACRHLARSHAVEMQVAESRWAYTCCVVANGSSCIERHR